MNVHRKQIPWTLSLESEIEKYRTAGHLFFVLGVALHTKFNPVHPRERMFFSAHAAAVRRARGGSYGRVVGYSSQFPAR